MEEKKRNRDAIGRRKKLNLDLDPIHFYFKAEAARETDQQQQQQEEEEEEDEEEEEAAEEAPATPGGAEGGEDEEEEEEDDEDDDAILESDDDENVQGATTEAEKLRRQANREAEAKLCQRLLGDLREEVASLETDEWEHEKPRFG